VRVANISEGYGGDFVEAVRSKIEPVPDRHTGVMVIGIDPLIYRSADNTIQSPNVRPPFVARINFDREQMARSLPFPVVLWLEKEAHALLLREAPDLSQWISARFDFGVRTSAVNPHLFNSLLQADRVLRRTDRSLPDERDIIEELQKLRSARSDSQVGRRIVLLVVLAQKYLLSSNRASFRRTMAELDALSKQIEEKEDKCMISLMLGSLEQLARAPKQAGKYFKLALDAARDSGSDKLEVRCLTSLGLHHAQTGDSRAAIRCLRDAVKQLEKYPSNDNKSDKLLRTALDGLGEAYYSIHKTKQSLPYFERALLLATQANDLREEAKISTRIADILFATKNLKKAAVYFERSRGLERRLGNRQKEMICLAKAGTAYVAVGEFRHGISLLEDSLQLSQQLGEEDIRAPLLSALLGAHIGIGETKTAIAIADQLDAAAEVLTNPKRREFQNVARQFRVQLRDKETMPGQLNNERRTASQRGGVAQAFKL